MDRDALSKTQVTHDEVIQSLTGQIANLNLELTVCKLSIQKLEEVIANELAKFSKDKEEF